jgi:hypothetical protein
VLEFFGEPATVLLIGAGGGLALGLAARLGKLCTLGMIEDVHYGQDYGRLWMWLTALGTAMILNFGAEALGFHRPLATLQLSQPLLDPRRHRRRAPLRLRHGAGRQLRLRRAGAARRRGHPGADDRHRDGCHGQRGLLRCARCGCARPSFPWSPRDPSHRASPMPSSGLTGLSHTAIGLALGRSRSAVDPPASTRPNACAASAGASSQASPSVRVSSAPTGSPPHGFGAWPVASHSFTAPIGETIHYAMFSSGLAPKFGMGSVLGVILGGAIGSFIQGRLPVGGLRRPAGIAPPDGRRRRDGPRRRARRRLQRRDRGFRRCRFCPTTAPIVAASIWIGAWIGLRHLIVGLEAA